MVIGVYIIFVVWELSCLALFGFIVVKAYKSPVVNSFE